MPGMQQCAPVINYTSACACCMCKKEIDTNVHTFVSNLRDSMRTSRSHKLSTIDMFLVNILKLCIFMCARTVHLHRFMQLPAHLGNSEEDDEVKALPAEGQRGRITVFTVSVLVEVLAHHNIHRECPCGYPCTPQSSLSVSLWISMRIAPAVYVRVHLLPAWPTSVGLLCACALAACLANPGWAPACVCTSCLPCTLPTSVWLVRACALAACLANVGRAPACVHSTQIIDEVAGGKARSIHAFCQARPVFQQQPSPCLMLMPVCRAVCYSMRLK